MLIHITVKPELTTENIFHRHYCYVCTAPSTAGTPVQESYCYTNNKCINIHMSEYSQGLLQRYSCLTNVKLHMLDKVARKYKALNNTKLCMYFSYKEEKGIYSVLAEISMKVLFPASSSFLQAGK